jgi:hypothetical protein
VTLGAVVLGSQFEIAFVTSQYTTATSPNIADYNNFVSAQALSASGYLSDFVPSGTTWNAIASTEATPAYLNAPNTGTVPVFTTAGQLVSDSEYPLFGGNLIAPLNDTQAGAEFNGTPVGAGNVVNTIYAKFGSPPVLEHAGGGDDIPF